MMMMTKWKMDSPMEHSMKETDGRLVDQRGESASGCLSTLV